MDVDHKRMKLHVDLIEVTIMESYCRAWLGSTQRLAKWMK